MALTVDSAVIGYLQRLSDAERLWLRERALELLACPAMSGSDGLLSIEREHIVDALVAAAGHDLFMIHDAEILEGLDVDFKETC